MTHKIGYFICSFYREWCTSGSAQISIEIKISSNCAPLWLAWQTPVNNTMCLLHLEHQCCPLLSRNACVALGLITCTDEEIGDVTTQHADFPSLFTGLGRVKTEVHITLQPDARPNCIYTPRTIPHPLLPNVKQELDSLLQQGVISLVTVPTAWCSGLIPVHKTNGNVRLCIDLTRLNKEFQWEIHPMPLVDENLAKLGKSRYFTKLVANSRF